jgi:hypothetical protein
MDAQQAYMQFLYTELLLMRNADDDGRIRRIKCDEAKPNCKKCESTGRKCDGYASRSSSPSKFEVIESELTSWSSSGRALTPALFARKPVPILPAPRIFNGNTMTADESRSFSYFQDRTTSQLSGFFESSFWNLYIPRTVMQEPAIRHAVIALGALHERFEAGDPLILRSNQDKLEGGFALQQYTTAIGRLIEPVSNSGQQALDIALTACILFTCFEVRMI